ncbi:uncharacterized protein B0T15DRAFT_385450 [Chaetomium strumarium]|uniref:Inosine/uridine-preferring nucleoside hydrolase domain-containing protein n=1 Tax=Chaetomium strumarium TaxID=1170767 RepID=A0AAJ0M6N9_9PEZI|nr:hypothetical protein B0T15DRAFT_385450 [Chaetomium strumarium]
MQDARPDTRPESTPRLPSRSIPFSKDDWQYSFYKKLENVVAKRKRRETPRIIVITDIEQDYDDLLAIIFLAEMHRMGAVELAGFIANHEPADRRAKFLRTVLHLLQLPNVPVAVGTVGTDDRAKHVHDHFYALKNETFENASWNKKGFKSGKDLIEELADPRRPLTMLLISSLQDMAEFFTARYKETGHEATSKYLQQRFTKFVSQGGYKIAPNRVDLIPVKGMMNNDYNFPKAENYCNGLVSFNLRSDAWSREAAKAARLEGSFMQRLFKYGPIGAHLRWSWLRQEFKFFWDPMNWPFMPHLKVDWYLNTRLGLEKNSPKFNHLKEKSETLGLGFEEVAEDVKVIAYDCCAAVGVVGDDFMREFGVLENRNVGQHRIFGESSDDLGGINPKKLSEVMQAFLLGGLKSTYDAANQMGGFQTLKHNPKASPYNARDFLSKILPLMKKMEEYKNRNEEGKARQIESKLRDIVGKVPTRDDIPYEQLYQEVVQRQRRK